MTESKLKNLGTGKILSLVMIVSLVAAVIFLVIQNLSLKTQVEQGLETADNLTAEIESVEKQVSEYKYALNEKDLDIAQKQEMLDERDALIKEKEDKIASLLSKNKISQKEAERLRGRMEQLEYYVKTYQQQIDVLKSELALKDGQIDSLKRQIGGTKDSLRQLSDRVIDQDIKLKGARKLSAHSFAFFRFKQSGTAVQESEFRGSQLDALRICFDIAENVSNQGEKMIYLCIHDPAGNLVKDDGKVGYFKNNGAHVPYSCMSKIQYEKQAMNACVEFEKPAGYKYVDGQYTVQAFCDGFEIGHSSFSVR